MSESLVVDASVVVKWYVPERGHAEARQIQRAYLDGAYDLTAPGILPFEVLNALRYGDLLPSESLIRVEESLAAYGLEFVPFGRIEAIATAAETLGETIYDGAYVALADDRNCAFYTADERLINAAANTEYAEFVRSIGAFP